VAINKVSSLGKQGATFFQEVHMRPEHRHASPTAAVLLIGEIKAAVDAFDRGDLNVFDAVDVVTDAIVAYQEAGRADRLRDAA